MASITLRGVRKSYDRQAVIHGIDMEIADGEFVVIVGPSGCGKSTLLRMVAGLETVTGGEILIDGAVVNEEEPKDRDIAMVFQNYALYPHMSVFDNMAYGLKLRGIPKAEIRRRVDRAAAILELGALLERKPRQLSGGQRQRVAMGRAIVREPKAFLFDEPLSNLDAKLRVQMRLEIQKLHRDLRTTSLYVTHDQVEAMTLAQRMVVMNGGRVEQIGTPQAVYHRPASVFVAGFIGAPPMNLLEGELDAEGRHFIPAGGAPLPLPAPLPALGRRRLTLGLRPEHLQPAADGLALDVQLVEALGAELLVHGRHAGQSVVVRQPDGTPPAYASIQHYRFAAEHLHWFDPVSGRRVDSEIEANAHFDQSEGSASA